MTISILLVTVLVFLPAAGDEIPPSLIENDVYTYIKKAARESIFLEAYNPTAKAGVLAMVEAEESREKPFCHFYRKMKILPKMDCEYIVFTKNGADQVAIMAFNVTDSGRNCLLIQINSMTDFIKNDILSHLKFFDKIGINHPFYDSRKNYTEIFTQLIQTVDFEDLEISGENDTRKPGEENMAEFTKSIAEFLSQFRDPDNVSHLHPEVESLGYFQLSDRYFCNVLLVHSDLFGYGVATSLFKIQDKKTRLLLINFKSNAESLIINAPLLVEKD